jgi:hypothetical protein
MGMAGATSQPCTWYADEDGDGYGDPESVISDCDEPPNAVEQAGDCDDGDPSRHPAAIEICDGRDNDCNGATSDVCPPLCAGFTYDAHAYMVCGGQSSHADATLACESVGMRLARIDDEDENDAIVENMAGLEYAWIGGSDQVVEGTWVWSDGKVFFKDGLAANGSFEAWYTNSPSNDSSSNCAEIWDDYTWDDYACGYKQPHICEDY